jgi:hypothetical protein
MALELGILAHIAGDHLAYLSGMEQQADPKVINPGIVADYDQPTRACTQQCLYGTFRNAAQPKPTQHERSPIRDTGYDAVDVWKGFVYHGRVAVS